MSIEHNREAHSGNVHSSEPTTATERKMQYQEYDFKVEQTVMNQAKETVTIIPSWEDSYERLLDLDAQFMEDDAGTEEQALCIPD